MLSNAPAPLPVPRRRRWSWYLLVSCGVLGLLAGGALLALLGYYTSRVPMPVDQVEVTEADQEALRERWAQFRQDLENPRFTEPLRISAKELNVFFSLLPRYRGRVHLSMTEDRMRGEVSFPLDLVLPGAGRGRYVNDVVVFKLRLGKNGLPDVEIVSAEVNGKRLPRWVERLLGRAGVDPHILSVLEVSAFSNRLKTLEVRDGQLLLAPRSSE